MTDTTAGEGHNNPPEGDPFALQLEEKNQDLWRQLGALETRRLKLPKIVEAEEQAALITEWTADARKLMREFEARRVEVKAPYLQRGQLIDDTFNAPKKTLGARAEDVEQRNGPYLKAKRDREEAERREQARIARERQEAAERAAAEARQRAADAAAAREKAEREAREAEARQAREEEEARQQATLDAQQKATETQQPQPVEPRIGYAQPRVDTEAARREALQAEQDAQAETERLETEARKAGVAAGRAEKKADQTDNLGKVSAGGANQKATMVWVGRMRLLAQAPSITWSPRPLPERSLCARRRDQGGSASGSACDFRGRLCARA